MQVQKAKQGYKLVKSLFGNHEEIPDDWDFTTIGNVAQIKRGASPRPIEDPKYFGHGRGWIRIRDVSNSYKYLEKTTDYLSELGESKSVPVNEGDLIMSIAATVGKPILLKMKACIHDGFVTFSNLSPQMDVEFLFYLLTNVENKLKSLGQHGSQSNINAEIVSKITFAKPSLSEQQKIASILSNVDSLISQTQKEIEHTQKLKKGLMQKLLTRGIGHTKFKKIKSLFGKYDEIPEEWESIRQIDVCEFINGYAYAATEFREKGYPIIRIQNLTGGTNYVYSDVELPEKQFAEKGDLLFAWSATFGPFIWDGPKAAYHYHQWKVIPKENTDKKFLYYHLDRISSTVKSMGQSGLGMFHMTKNGMERLQMNLPPIQEQQKIAFILSNIDSQIQKQQEYESKLESLKKGLMQKLLTGQIRVKV